MSVFTRNPRCHVRIISLEYGDISADTIRPSLRRVSTHRRIGTAAGSFEIHLLPRRTGTFGLPVDWRDALGAMDYVEISIEVAPRPPTIVMRGFIDTVAEHGSFDGQGRPTRTVQINGRDFGKLLLTTKLYYVDEFQLVAVLERWRAGFIKLFAWQSGTFPPPEHPPLALNVNTDAPTYAPVDLLRNIFETFYEPQQETILKNFPTVLPMKFFPVTNALTNTNERNLATIAPDVLSLNWTPYTDMWTLLRLYQHIPWRELYVIDEAEGPLLTYRPTPWITFTGQFIYQGMETGHMGTMLTHQIEETNIIEYSLSHSDVYSSNFFFTYTDEFGSLAQMVKTIGSLEGVSKDAFKGNPYLVGYQATDRAKEMRSDYNIMGFRLQEVRTPYLDFDHRTSQGQIQVRLRDVREQGLEENLKFTRAYDHASVLEFGYFHVRGDERIQIGHYIQLKGDTLLRLGDGARYYVEGVTQTFQQGSTIGDGTFVTTAEVSRGRGHMMRKGLVAQ